MRDVRKGRDLRVKKINDAFHFFLVKKLFHNQKLGPGTTNFRPRSLFFIITCTQVYEIFLVQITDAVGIFFDKADNLRRLSHNLHRP